MDVLLGVSKTQAVFTGITKLWRDRILFKGAVCKKCISNNHKMALICH